MAIVDNEFLNVMSSRSKEKERCEYCGKEFPRNGHLNRHIREVHKIKLFKRIRSDNPPTFHCTLTHLNVPCSAVFRSRRSLQRHKQRYNQENKPPKPKSLVLRKSCTKPSAAELEKLQKNDKVNAILSTFPSHYGSVEFNYQVTRFVEFPIFAEYEFTVTDVSEIKEWKKNYEEKNKIFFRKDRTCKSKKECVLYKQRYHCGRYIPDQRNCKHGERNTNCPFTFSIRVKIERNSSLVVRIQLKNEHNHDLESAESVKFRPVSEEVREKFLCLFHYGFTPARALKTHAKDLEDEYGENVHSVKGDRYYDPDINWVNRLHDNVFKKELGSQCAERMLDEVSKKIEESECAKLHVFDDNINYVISIVTPFMLRVHDEFEQSSEIAFMTSTGILDRVDCTVFTLFTNGNSGALPLGVIITTVENRESTIIGLKMIQELLTETSFGGRGGSRGPTIFITDSSTDKRAALHEVFPDSKLLFSQCHVLQAMWRSIWTDSANILLSDRTTLFSLFKSTVYEEQEEIFERKMKQLLTNETVRQYATFVKRVEDFLKSKELWATWSRTNLNTRDQSTNNICETEMRIIDEILIERSRAFSPANLFSILTTEFEKYFVDKLVSLSESLIPNDLQEKLEKLIKKCAEEDCHASNETTFKVDVDNGLCSCVGAMDGKSCEHLLIILRDTNIASNWTTPSDGREQQKFFYVATGRILEPKEEWIIEQVSSPTPESPPEYDLMVEEIEESLPKFEEFDSMCEEIKLLASKYPFVKFSLDEMVNTFREMNSPAELEYAMRWFGKRVPDSLENVVIEE